MVTFTELLGQEVFRISIRSQIMLILSLQARDVDTGALWSRIADLVIKTVISGEHDIVIRTRKNIKSR